MFLLQSVFLSMCLSVYLSVQAVELLKVEASFLVHTYLLTISTSSLSRKVIG